MRSPAALIVFGVLYALGGALDARAAGGEQWEYQGTVEMMGMKLPIAPTKVCQQPDAPQVPPMEGTCSFSDVSRKGGTTKFSFTCEPPEAATGSGIAVLKDNQIITKYAMTTEDGEGTVTLLGKRLGACEP